MLVGLLSDSHGKVDATRYAVQTLRDAGAAMLIHCGDIGSVDVIAELAGGPAVFVFGNNDYDTARYTAFADKVGVQCGVYQAEVRLDSQRAIVTHGDDAAILRSVVRSQAVDYLFVGHTHVPADSRNGRIRVINPGALYRTRLRTFALLNTFNDTLQTFEVPAGDP